MGKMRTFRTVFWALLLLTTISTGLSIINYNVTIDLEANPKQTILMEMFNDEAIAYDKLSYILDKEPISLKVASHNALGQEENIPFTVEQADNGYKIDFDLVSPLDPAKTKIIIFRFNDPTIVSEVKDEMLFTFGLQPSIPMNQFTLFLHLPPGAGVSGTSAKPLAPPPDTILSDGRRVYVAWSLDNVKAGDNLSFFALYRFYGKGEQNGKNNSSAQNLITGILLGIIIGALSMHFVTKKPDLEQFMLFVLTEDENTVVAVLKEHNGEMRQDELGEEIGFSRPKLSKVVRRLEEKKIIDKTPYKKTNLLRVVQKLG